MNLTIHLLNASEAESVCRELTRSLPEYFGIHEANERYAKGVRELPTFGAKLNDIHVGLISCEMPFSNNATIYWMAVKKEYHGQGIGQALLSYAEAYCLKKQCTSMTVETLSPAEKDPNYIKTYAFYTQNGFEPLFELNAYGPNLKMIYLYKRLRKDDTVALQKITRIGVYGIAIEEGKMLAVRQKRGPYAGKLDFPGGGIEFGESADNALRREFSEEVGMEFDSLQLIDNLTATVDVSRTPAGETYLFYQIGMIYRVHGCRLIEDKQPGDLPYIWIDPKTLSEERCSPLLWKFVRNHHL